MGDYLKRVCRFYVLIALALLTLGFVGVWPVIVVQGIAFLGVLAALAALLGGAITWMFRGPGPATPRRWLAFALPPLLTVATLAVAIPLLEAGCYAGNLAKLAVNRSRYDAIVANPRPTKLPLAWNAQGGPGYATEPGPPVRIVFASNRRETVSPWGIILYDPSDAAAETGFDRSGNPVGTLNRAIADLNPITGCWHLSGHYYTCWCDWM